MRTQYLLFITRTTAATTTTNCLAGHSLGPAFGPDSHPQLRARPAASFVLAADNGTCYNF